MITRVRPGENMPLVCMKCNCFTGSCKDFETGNLMKCNACTRKECFSINATATLCSKCQEKAFQEAQTLVLN